MTQIQNGTIFEKIKVEIIPIINKQENGKSKKSRFK